MMLSEETSAVRPQKQTRFNGAKLVWMLKGSPLTVTGAVIIVLMRLMMIFSPWLATHDPNAIDLTARLLPPSAAHWFGTDEVGRDLFSRVLVGSQQSILAGLVVVAIAGMIGSLLGCLSGVLGGRADAIIMRIMDIMLSIPSLVLTMALAAALGPSLFNAMLAIAIVRIPFYVRLARGQALVVRQYTYVQAAKTFGASRITDEMLMSASETLAQYSPLVLNGEGLVLPELKDIQKVSRAIAFAVGKMAQQQGVAVKTSAEALQQAIDDNFWQAEYRDYRRTSI